MAEHTFKHDDTVKIKDGKWKGHVGFIRKTSKADHYKVVDGDEYPRYGIHHVSNLEKSKNPNIENVHERVLTVDQRRKRSMAMRRNKEKLLRARERAKGRQAPDKNIKQRAYKLARELARKKVAGDRGANYANMSDSEKIQMDKLLDTPEKIKMIKKMAERLIPKVRRMEQDRLQSFMKGHQLKNLGQKEGNHHMKEDLNSLFNEYFAGGVPGRGALGGPAQNSNKMIGKDKDNKKDNGSPIKQYEPFNDKKEAKIKEALDRKSEKSGIDFDVLAEVFVRGVEAYPDNYKVTLEQYAFARVNSFINQGKTYFNEDADLQEACASTAKVKKLEKEVDELEAAHKSPSAHKKSLKNEDTELQEVSLDAAADLIDKARSKFKDTNHPVHKDIRKLIDGINYGEYGSVKSATKSIKQHLGESHWALFDSESNSSGAKDGYYVSNDKTKKLIHSKNKPFSSYDTAERERDKAAENHDKKWYTPHTIHRVENGKIQHQHIFNDRHQDYEHSSKNKGSTFNLKEDTDLQELSKKTLTSYLQKTKNGTGKDFPNPLSFRKSMEAQGIAKAKLGKKPKRSSVPDVKVMAGGKKSVKEDTDLQEAEVKNHYYVTYNSIEKGHKLLHPKKKPFTSMLDAKRHIEKIAPGHPERRSLGRIHTVNVATGRITSITNYDGNSAGYPSTPGIGDSKELHQLKETFDMEDFKKKMTKDKTTREKYSGYYQTPKGSGNVMGHDHDKPEHVIVRVNKSTGVRSKNNDEYEDHSVHPKDLKVYKDGKWSPISESKFRKARDPWSPDVPLPKAAYHPITGKINKSSPAYKQHIKDHYPKNLWAQHGIKEGLDEAEKMKGKDPCWKDYKMIGTKKKNGKKVPNCVPESVTPVEGEGSSARKQIQTVPRATDNRKTTGRSTHQQEVLKKIVEQKLGNTTADPKKRLTGTDSLVATYKKDTPFAEDANSSDRKPVVIPSFVRRNDDGSTVTIPAKTVLRKSNRKILGSGNPHDGKTE